jgi:hypothetical protein
MDLKTLITIVNKIDKNYLIDCLDKHGYVIKRILDNPIDPMLLCKYLVELSYSEKQRKQLQKAVEDEMTNRMGKMFKTINDSDLDYLFKRIDYFFFGNSLQTLFPTPVIKCMEQMSKDSFTLGSYELRTNSIKINTKLLLDSMENKPHEVRHPRPAPCALRFAAPRRRPFPAV